MTILAGIYSRNPKSLVNDVDCASIKEAISRNPDDTVVTFRDNRVFLAKVDIGAYGDSAIRIDPEGCVSVLSGEPLLAEEGASLSKSRSQDLESFHHAWLHERWEILAKSQGVFCAAHYSPLECRLTLISDKLCIRPLYYWQNDKYIVFATALRILEDLPIVHKIMDLRAVTEITTLGYPLGTRTPYADISLLKAGEIVHFWGNSISRSQYFRWDKIPTSNLSETELLNEAYERFVLAIGRRLRSDTAIVAFLSGGLDSRCVVAGLRSKNITVFSFNFSRPNSQDRIFAEEFAQRVGTIHTVTQLNIESTLTMALASRWHSSRHRFTKPAERPGLVWSGDGGSVGVGHVYLNKAIVDLLRRQDFNCAINSFLEDQQAKVVRRLLKPVVASSLANILIIGIREELDDIKCNDPGRKFHIFLMLNDQRRHLASHFEEIDLHRMEFHLPFFDAHFLEWILACPVDLCLGHHFYTKWLNHFPPVVRLVPWQIYPGHEPCPVSMTDELPHQWQKKFLKEGSKAQKHSLLQHVAAILKSNDFPHPIMRRQRLYLATWLYRIGLRDYGYVVKTARIISKYWTICDGNFIMPE